MIKKFTCLLLLFVSSLAGMNLKILADEPGNNKTTLTQLRSSDDKKRIPSRTFIECEAINGMLVFDANFEYEFISVSVIGEDATTSIEGTIAPPVLYPMALHPIRQSAVTIQRKQKP